MRLLVDVMPTEPEECIFMEYMEAVSDDVLDEAEVCEDCGGLMIDDKDVELVHGCFLTGCRCTLDDDGECEYLANGYVTNY